MTLLRACIAEAIGTFIIVFFGVGVVHSAVLTNSQIGLWQVAVVWGAGVALAIHATAPVSGAHLNPAITAAMAAFGGFDARRMPAYWIAQFLGAAAAAETIYLLFSDTILFYEAARGIVRGAEGSIATARCYGEYFPNPGMQISDSRLISESGACAVEAAGTAVLSFMIFALTRGKSGRGSSLAPLLIGLTVASLISLFAPLTQAGFNPARDFGARFIAWVNGWGDVAIPGPRGGFFTVYIVSPIAGAVAGAAAWRVFQGRVT